MQFSIEKILQQFETKGDLTIMAFDFGTQKMGIAVGQKSLETSQALALFPMKDGIPHWDNLFKIIQEWQPQLFLVGLPLNMDDSESELALRAKKFARRLRHQTQTATFMLDERLTTREARRFDSRHAIDSIAASLLIEQWYYDPLLVSHP